jgi:hypothetical protein
MRRSVRCTTHDITTPLTWGFAARDAGGNVRETNPRPPKYHQVSACKVGRGREKGVCETCDSVLDASCRVDRGRLLLAVERLRSDRRKEANAVRQDARHRVAQSRRSGTRRRRVPICRCRPTSRLRWVRGRRGSRCGRTRFRGVRRGGGWRTISCRARSGSSSPIRRRVDRVRR